MTAKRGIYSNNNHRDMPQEPAPVDRGVEAILERTRTYWTTHGPISPGTMTSTKNCMRSMVKKAGEVEFSADWVARVVGALDADHQNEATKNVYMAAIKRVFEAHGCTAAVPTFKIIHVEHFHYRPAEVARLIRAARTVPHTAIISFLYYQAPRNGELCALKMSDLDVKEGEVRIYGQKTHKWRTIPLHPEVLPSLRAWLDMRKNAAVPILEEQGLPVPGEVFLNQAGKKFDVESIRLVVLRAARRAGFEGKALEEAHPHTLRHSCANHLLHEHGWDMPSVAYYLGDTIATVEKYYAHTGVQDCRRNMERMRR